jgi:hypothetical protein
VNSRREQTRARLEGRCETLAEMIKRLRPLYVDPASGADQRRFVETVVGAALWYLPEVEECWTGGMSVAALRSCHPALGDGQPKLTKDHEYPRKLAATELLKRLDEQLDAAKILDLYLGKYGRYNYVTPQENKALVPYQKAGVFEDPVRAYERAGVHLLKLTLEDLRCVNARRQDVIEALLSDTPP